MQGYLVFEVHVFPEGGAKGFGTAVVATRAKFDITFFPAVATTSACMTPSSRSPVVSTNTASPTTLPT
jgi:hypothetical protein